MSGIYIHVPYCKVKCEYCDFYSEANAVGLNIFANLIEKELSLRKNYLPNSEIETIYLGGGTPSLLTASQIDQIINSILKEFSISPDLEITLEANPDDLTPEFLKAILQVGTNRLSIGVQSFSDSDLKSLGRRHNAQQAIDAVLMSHNVGFENISIDLIYGLPYSSTQIWEANLKRAFELPIRHLSSYHLIYEEGTPLHRKVNKGTIIPVDEDKSVEQFGLLQAISNEHGFIHYEISNLAKEGYFSKHNTSYWQQIPYLGLGPSAHSYNGETREWNPKSTLRWSSAINHGIIEVERENLTERDKLNDYLLTSLRTIWGVNLEILEKLFGTESRQSVERIAQKYLGLSLMEQIDEVLKIPPKHYLTSDGIIADFLAV